MLDFAKHLSPEALEAYLLERLPGQKSGRSNDLVEQIENHLLCCQSCLADAEILDRSLSALKRALMRSTARVARVIRVGSF